MDSSNKGVEEKWIFTLEQVERSPSIVDGFSKTKELLLRRQTSNFIKDMGQQLKVFVNVILFFILAWWGFY